MKIKNIYSHEIIASGGYPSLETIVELEDGSTGKASVPYGASAGSYEATVLLDEDKSRFSGKGMLKAVENINTTIKDSILGWDAYDQRAIDNRMKEVDGTQNKANLGGNAILSVSIAVTRAAAKSRNLELYEHIGDHFVTKQEYKQLPKPMAVVIEGGKHADNSTDIQEYCLTVISQKNAMDGITKFLETYHQLKKVLVNHGFNANVGNEGAFAPAGISTNTKPFELILEAMHRAGYSEKDLGISIDAAANEFYEDGEYNLSIENRKLSADEIIDYYESWIESYPIVTVEDLLHEDEWDNWHKLKQMTDEHGVRLIGDDLTVTNLDRLKKAIDNDSISGILIKLNQIGTVTETVDACMHAKANGLIIVPSHRGGGETNDTAIVDLAVAVGADYIKVGPTRGERVEKYNRLLEIERITN